MKYMYMKPVWKAVFVLVALSHMYAYFLASTKAWYSNTRPKELKYVGFTINWGRMCNQVSHFSLQFRIAKGDRIKLSVLPRSVHELINVIAAVSPHHWLRYSADS